MYKYYFWAFWPLLVLENVFMALRNKCFAQICVHLLPCVCCWVYERDAAIRWQKQELEVRIWDFFPALCVFVWPFNLPSSLTALCEQTMPLVLLELLPEHAGDAQPLWQTHSGQNSPSEKECDMWLKANQKKCLYILEKEYFSFNGLIVCGFFFFVLTSLNVAVGVGAYLAIRFLYLSHIVLW